MHEHSVTDGRTGARACRRPIARGCAGAGAPGGNRHAATTASARVCGRDGAHTRGCAGAGAPDQATQHVDYHSAFTGERAWMCSCWRQSTSAGAQAQVHQLEHQYMNTLPIIYDICMRIKYQAATSYVCMRTS